jgi:hypothetical protein
MTCWTAAASLWHVCKDGKQVLAHLERTLPVICTARIWQFQLSSASYSSPRYSSPFLVSTCVTLPPCHIWATGIMLSVATSSEADMLMTRARRGQPQASKLEMRAMPRATFWLDPKCALMIRSLAEAWTRLPATQRSMQRKLSLAEHTPTMLRQHVCQLA